MSISGHRTRAAFGRYIIASEKGLCEAVIKTSTYVESLTQNQRVASVVPIYQRSALRRVK